MHYPLKYFYILFIVSILCLNATEVDSHHSHHKNNRNDHHIHSKESNEFMFGYQLGYTEIHYKNNQIADDSGLLLGVHLMKKIEQDIFQDKLFFAAGAHTTFTEDKHIGLMVGIMYEINEGTILSIMPGLMFMKHNHGESNSMKMPHAHMTHTSPDWETEAAIHFELSHQIRLFNQKLHPSISWMPSDSHDQYSFGLNFHF